jgi:HSP20 family protein
MASRDGEREFEYIFTPFFNCPPDIQTNSTVQSYIHSNYYFFSNATLITMPFFPRFHYPETSSFLHHAPNFPTDILRFLHELDDVSSSSASDDSSPTGRRAFSPSFDVHETEHEYVLEGELPGLSDKKNVTIEFTDDKTILVQGKIERSVKMWSNDQSKLLESLEGQKMLKEGGDVGTSVEGGKEGEKEKKKEEREREKRPKYWVSERSVGEFSRSFSFPAQVDIGKVKAGLEHGILKIVVPKLEKKGARRIEVEVS